MTTTLTIKNASSHAFRGWRRCVIEAPNVYYVPGVGTILAHDRQADGIRVVFAHAYGEANRLWAVDVYGEFAGNSSLAIEIREATKDRHQLEPIPANWQDQFGKPSISYLPMQLVDAVQDGAAWKFSLRLRPQDTSQNSMFLWQTWLRWYPEHKGWMEGELLLACSNTGLPYLTAITPLATELRFSGKDTVVRSPGWPLGSALLPAGEVFGDGQARAWPILVAWLDQIQAPFENLAAIDEFAIAGHGVTNFYLPVNSTGSPYARPAAPFWAQYQQDVKRSLHRWQASPLGVTQNSGQTGAQEDQVFVGGEALDPVAAQLRYWIALTQLRRPCHHLEPEGTLIAPGSRTSLMLWDGRPLWISQDQLGKPRGLQPQEAHEWWGPDVEHWLLNTMAVAAQTTDSDAIQWGLEAQAIVYLHQWTTAAGLSTSQTYASRAVGWECFAVLHLIRNLRNRTLAKVVRHRWQDRLRQIIVPVHGNMAPAIWDVRVDDGRLGPGPRWIPWQQAVEAAGLLYAAQYIINHSIDDKLGLELHSMAVAGATMVLDCGWRYDGIRWLSNPSGLSTVDGSGGEWGESFNFFGMSMAPAVAILALPADHPHAVKARNIWEQLKKTDATNQWLLPGI